ncbi:MAG: tetratricopeptide repeat protein [Gemmatimonadales bacterium]
MTIRFWSALLTVAVAVPAAAWAQNQEVIKAQPTRYEAPECVKPGHFKVSSAASRVQSALNSPENSERLLREGHDVLIDAIAHNDQGMNPAAWYWLTRIYLYQGNVAGADSALSKTLQLQPACRKELDPILYNTYLALLRPAAQYMQANQPDSAMALLEHAITFYNDGPHAYRFLGVLFFNRRQYDSAATYFETAMTKMKMPRDSSMRTETAFSLAASYQNTEQFAKAIPEWRKYLGWRPDDTDARKALAQAFRAAGMPDSAQAVEAELLASAGAAGDLSPDEMLNLGVNAFNDDNYKDAVHAFQGVLEKNPYYRRALYNLANTYLKMGQADSLIAVSQRLLAIDPLNENNIRLLAQGYQSTKNNEQTVRLVTILLGLPVNVEVTEFQAGEGSARLAGTATGREAQDASGKRIAAGPITLVFEFIDRNGNAVGQPQEVPLGTLATGEVKPFTLEGQGAGIVGWRYKKK